MDKNNLELKQKLIKYASDIGIDKIGFTSAEPFYEFEQYLIQCYGLGYESGLEEKDIKKRTDPQLSLKNAQSIISIAVAYPSKLGDFNYIEGEYRGFVTCSAWGLDYHLVLEDKLNRLCDFLKKQESKAEYVYMTDRGVLSDKAVAERSGIGWIGKNSLLITPEYGSYVFLGEIITNIKISEDKPIKEQCGDCIICLELCPNNAIIEPKQINSKRCLSYLTQKKGAIEDQYLAKLDDRLYGCDTCQQVCPKNRGINYTHQKEFFPDLELAKPLLKPLLEISKDEFNNRWDTTAAGWRGKTIIQRNVIISLGNLKDKSAITKIRELLISDNREIIRYISAWALGNIGGEQAREALYESKRRERALIVLNEVEKSLEKLRV